MGCNDWSDIRSYHSVLVDHPEELPKTRNEAAVDRHSSDGRAIYPRPGSMPQCLPRLLYLDERECLVANTILHCEDDSRLCGGGCL